MSIVQINVIPTKLYQCGRCSNYDLIGFFLNIPPMGLIRFGFVYYQVSYSAYIKLFYNYIAQIAKLRIITFSVHSQPKTFRSRCQQISPASQSEISICYYSSTFVRSTCEKCCWSQLFCNRWMDSAQTFRKCSLGSLV